jgi:hypothetical protein
VSENYGDGLEGFRSGKSTASPRSMDFFGRDNLPNSSLHSDAANSAAPVSFMRWRGPSRRLEAWVASIEELDNVAVIRRVTPRGRGRDLSSVRGAGDNPPRRAAPSGRELARGSWPALRAGHPLGFSGHRSAATPRSSRRKPSAHSARRGCRSARGPLGP